MEIEKKDSFPAEDGHIESILIGVDQVKISFQTWDSRKLIFIFDNVDIIISSHSVYGNISGFEVIFGKNKLKNIFSIVHGIMKIKRIRKFYQYEAEKMEIFQVGTGAEINSAIFDVGYEYVGEQNVHIMNNNPDF